MSRIGASLLSCLLVSNLALASEEGAVTTANQQRLVAGALEVASLQLEAHGPGILFASIDAAAIDALIYAHLQGLATGSSERMRGGTIYRTGDGYGYGDLYVAGPLDPNRLRHALHSQDVARFLIYPRVGRHKVDRANERPSQVDRRSVNVTDPLHRPLYILHPSLVIRKYRGEDHELIEVADLRRPAQSPLIAGDCSACTVRPFSVTCVWPDRTRGPS